MSNEFFRTGGVLTRSSQLWKENSGLNSYFGTPTSQNRPGLRLLPSPEPLVVPARDVLTSLAFTGKAAPAGSVKVAVIALRDVPFAIDLRTGWKRSRPFDRRLITQER